MPDDVEVLREARSLLVADRDEYIWQGRWVSLCADLHVSATRDERFRKHSIPTTHIIHDVWNICALVHRLAWMRDAALTSSFLRDMWRSYASVDIEHFHTEMRSIMDYAAALLGGAANKKGQIPQSFRELREWISKIGNRNRLGPDLAEVVKSAGWFPSLREVRDALIHTGGFVLVFGRPSEGILFQVHKHLAEEGLISRGYLMYNDNVAFFDRYAALQFSYLLNFLERLAAAVSDRLQLQSVERSASCRSPGFGVLMAWMDELIGVIENNG